MNRKDDEYSDVDDKLKEQWKQNNPVGKTGIAILATVGTCVVVPIVSYVALWYLATNMGKWCKGYRSK